MYKDCKTEQSAVRQRQLEQGLLQAMLQQRFDEISVSGLCDQLQVPRKSFYRYFSSKDGALFALLDHTMLDFFRFPFQELNSRQGTAQGDLERYFLFWYTNRDLLEALQRSQLSGLLVERATSLAMSEHLMPRRMQSWAAHIQSAALSFSICGLTSMVLRWHVDGYPLSAAEMASIATEMLTKPLIG